MKNLKIKFLKKKYNSIIIEKQKNIDDAIEQAWLEDEAMRIFRENNKTPDMEILRNALVKR